MTDWSGYVALSVVFLLFYHHGLFISSSQIKLQAAWEAQFLNILDIADPVSDGLDAVGPQAAVLLPPDGPGVERFVMLAGEDEEIRLTHRVYKDLVMLRPGHLHQPSLQDTQVVRPLLQALFDGLLDVRNDQGRVGALLLHTDQIHCHGLKVGL